MDCASFENALTEMLGDPTDPTLQRERLSELRAHAAGCPECRGAAELVELAALPPTQRDPVDMPPESYWEGFGASISGRMGTPPNEQPRGVLRRYAAAAAVIVALFGGWSLRGWLDPSVQPQPFETARQADSGDWSCLDDVIRQATAEELADALRGLPGEWTGVQASGWAAGESGLGGDWMPDALELDENDRLELMDWLDQLEQAERRPSS
jgi:hypothetical protein